jgi:hypothetical protein
MTREETKAIMAILKAGYPNFYKGMTKEDATNAINLWATMFEKEPAQIVTEAVRALMCTLKYPPTIADVKEKIELLTQPEQMTEMEAWNLVRKAMNTSDFVKSFQELPPIIRRIVGSVSQLKEWAYTEGDISVISSNFMRSYRARAAHERELARLPQSAKAMITELAEGMKMIE